MKYVFLALGLMGSIVSWNITSRMVADWDTYLIVSDLHPNFVIGFVWFVSIMCFVFASMFAVNKKGI